MSTGYIKGLIAQYPDATAMKLFDALDPTLTKLAPYNLKIAFVCVGISLLLRWIDSFRDGKPIQFIDLFIHAIVVVIGLKIWAIFFLTLCNLCNYYADLVFSVDDIEQFVNGLLSKIIQLDNIHIFKLNIKELLCAILGFFSIIFSVGLFAVRKVLLGLFFILGGLAIALSPLPNFGFNMLLRVIQQSIQVAAWVIIHSAFFLIMSQWLNATSISSIEYIILASVMLVVSMIVPMIARVIFGGSEFAALPIATNMASYKIIQKIIQTNQGVIAKAMGSDHYRQPKGRN